ncbi:hypothetical protein PAHAL_2G258700 [Panicum hallii]|uniref:Uncharacterized protein n=1 Tax=Panicum hallii TaxID=206008 RepID=A0A2T8KQE0_9POAL|nr:hypothetical protein PAHAL_2G258700 [Panicum hallii]
MTNYNIVSSCLLHVDSSLATRHGNTRPMTWFQLGRLFKFSVQTFQVQGWMRHGLVKAWDLRREDWTNLINDK